MPRPPSCPSCPANLTQMFWLQSLHDVYLLLNSFVHSCSCLTAPVVNKRMLMMPHSHRCGFHIPTQMTQRQQQRGVQGPAQGHFTGIDPCCRPADESLYGCTNQPDTSVYVLYLYLIISFSLRILVLLQTAAGQKFLLQTGLV